jgi:hypothetical protein
MTWHLVADIASAAFTVLVLIAYLNLRSLYRELDERTRDKTHRLGEEVDRVSERVREMTEEYRAGFETLGLQARRTPSMKAHTVWVKEDSNGNR